jgi:hypothetical protein
VIFGETHGAFIQLYAVLSGLFIGLLIIIFAISNRIFEESRMEDSKDSTKIVVMVLSMGVTLYQFFLQIPFTSVLLQGFICGENLSIDTTSSDCGTLES